MNIEIMQRVREQAHRDELAFGAGFTLIIKMLMYYENLSFEVAGKTAEGLMDQKMIEMLDGGWEPDVPLPY